MVITDTTIHCSSNKPHTNYYKQKSCNLFPTDFLSFSLPKQTPPYFTFFLLLLKTSLHLFSYFKNSKPNRNRKKNNTVTVTQHTEAKEVCFVFVWLHFSPMGARCSKLSLCWWPSHIKSNHHNLSDNGVTNFFSHFTGHFQ